MAPQLEQGGPSEPYALKLPPLGGPNAQPRPCLEFHTSEGRPLHLRRRGHADSRGAIFFAWRRRNILSILVKRHCFGLRMDGGGLGPWRAQTVVALGLRSFVRPVPPHLRSSGLLVPASCSWAFPVSAAGARDLRKLVPESELSATTELDSVALYARQALSAPVAQSRSVLGLRPRCGRGLFHTRLQPRQLGWGQPKPLHSHLVHDFER